MYVHYVLVFVTYVHMYVCMYIESEPLYLLHLRTCTYRSTQLYYNEIRNYEIKKINTNTHVYTLESLLELYGICEMMCTAL